MEKGYYKISKTHVRTDTIRSQSTIKMEKGYYTLLGDERIEYLKSQSTIKMEKGYYTNLQYCKNNPLKVAIHNKNGKGLLPE